jgi:hypothetical protein
MKRAILLITFLLLIPSISASHIFVNVDSLAEGDAEAFETDNGIYIVELLAVSDSQNKAKFSVNDEASDTLRVGESYEFEDGSVLIVREILVQASGNDRAEYYFYGTGNNPIPIDINVDRFDIEDCNFDGICQENETQKHCCYDCGCEPLYKCEDNDCIRQAGCISDEECNDEKGCTEDSCIEGKCSYKTLDGCELNGKCLEYSTTKEIDSIQSYCSNNIWNPQKQKDETCHNDYECLSGKCKKNKCYEKSSKGLFTTIVIILVIILIYFSFKKFKVIKKIKRYLFWK